MLTDEQIATYTALRTDTQHEAILTLRAMIMECAPSLDERIEYWAWMTGNLVYSPPSLVAGWGR